MLVAYRLREWNEQKESLREASLGHKVADCQKLFFARLSDSPSMKIHSPAAVPERIQREANRESLRLCAGKWEIVQKKAFLNHSRPIFLFRSYQAFVTFVSTRKSLQPAPSFYCHKRNPFYLKLLPNVFKRLRSSVSLNSKNKN